MSNYVGYRSSVDFIGEWEKKYGEQEKAPLEKLVVFVSGLVKKFVVKFGK